MKLVYISTLVLFHLISAEVRASNFDNEVSPTDGEQDLCVVRLAEEFSRLTGSPLPIPQGDVVHARKGIFDSHEGHIYFSDPNLQNLDGVAGMHGFDFPHNLYIVLRHRKWVELRNTWNTQVWSGTWERREKGVPYSWQEPGIQMHLKPVALLQNADFRREYKIGKAPKSSDP